MIFSPTISLIAIGVDRASGQSALTYAQSDARRIAAAFASQLGPVRPENARLLLGGNATWRNLDELLERMERLAPTFLVLSFSGHGNNLGIALVDGLYSFERLRRRLERIRMRGALVLLDSCGSGAFAKAATVEGVGSVEAEWWPLLLAAVPGVRVLMASTASGSTVEIPGIGGAFTDSIIRAMRLQARGDLRARHGSFVSDELVSRRAERFMRQQGLRPTSAGTFGGFPLAIANDRPCGSAEVKRISPLEDGSVDVTVTLRNRRLLPTRIVATASASGGQWQSQSVDVMPATSLSAESARFAIDLGSSREASLNLAILRRCVIAWSFQVLDAEGRCLTEDAYRVAYAA